MDNVTSGWTRRARAGIPIQGDGITVRAFLVPHDPRFRYVVEPDPPVIPPFIIAVDTELEVLKVAGEATDALQIIDPDAWDAQYHRTMPYGVLVMTIISIERGMQI